MGSDIALHGRDARTQFPRVAGFAPTVNKAHGLRLEIAPAGNKDMHECANKHGCDKLLYGIM